MENIGYSSFQKLYAPAINRCVKYMIMFEVTTSMRPKFFYHIFLSTIFLSTKECYYMTYTHSG